MIPTGGSVQNQSVEIVQQPSLTWKLDIERGKITGIIDELEAVKQAVLCIFETERFYYLIYSANYGFEGDGLVGKSRTLVQSEIKRRITEALMQDDRITNVTDFDIQFEGDTATAAFTVITQYGSFRQEVQMNV